MNTELLKAFEANGRYIGTYTREEVHTKGLWHETFHCWFICKEKDKYYIHFQVRSNQKKDYPNKLDISAAGHISSNESVSDGIREVHEELGINVSIIDLISIGTIPLQIVHEDFIDREIEHVFLYIIPGEIDDQYEFQKEEVSGIMKIELNAFEQLLLDNIDRVQAKGIVSDADYEKVCVKKSYRKEDFLLDDHDYISVVLKKFKEIIEQ